MRVPDGCDRQPWYCGISKEQQNQAISLYEEGNQSFDDSLFKSAVESYRAALQHWDHPSIHYNLMLALVGIDRPLDAYESSIAALRYGPDALRPEEYQRALDYQKILRRGLALLEVNCDEPDTEISLNGKEFFRAPGTVRRFVMPGQHELVAKKKGYLTVHQSLLLLPDRPVRVRVAMLPAEEALLTTQRWDTWKPWTVVGAGVGLGLVGGALEWRASANNNAFKALFDKQCPPPKGCFQPSFSSEMQSAQLRSTWYRRVGYGAAGLGAAAAITGLVLVYVNRPLQIENPVRKELIQVSVAPAVTPESASVGVRVDF